MDQVNERLAEYGMRIEFLDLEQIKRYPNNPNKHPREQIEALSGFIQDIGFLSFLWLDKDYEIINGEGRLDALILAKRTKGIPCVICYDLSKLQAAKLRLADNQLARKSVIDDYALGEELRKLEQNSIICVGIGFDEEELKAMMAIAEKNLEGPEVPASSLSHDEGIEPEEGLWTISLRFKTREEAEDYLMRISTGKHFRQGAKSIGLTVQLKDL